MVIARPRPRDEAGSVGDEGMHEVSEQNGWQAPGNDVPPGYGPPPGSAPPPGYGPPPGHGPQPGGYGSASGGPDPRGGWAPPPKPGLIPLRPLGFGTLLGAPFAELRRNARPVVGSSLLIQGVITIVSILVVGAVGLTAALRVTMADPADRDAVAAGAIAGVLLSMLVPVVLGLVGSAFLQGIIVTDVARGTLGEKLTLRELWRAARGRVWPLAGWIVLLTLGLLVLVLVVVGIAAGFAVTGVTPLIVTGIVLAVLAGLGAVVLAVWLYIKTSLTPCLIVMERAGIRRAVARSWHLTHRSFWRTFGVQALIALIVNAVSEIVTVPFTLVFGFAGTLLAPTGSGSSGSGGSPSGGAVTVMIVGYAILLIVSLVISALTTVVQSAAVALIYIDLRMRREGLDLQLLRFVEARGTGEDVPDPYLVPPAAGRSGNEPVA